MTQRARAGAIKHRELVRVLLERAMDGDAAHPEYPAEVGANSLRALRERRRTAGGDDGRKPSSSP